MAVVEARKIFKSQYKRLRPGYYPFIFQGRFWARRGYARYIISFRQANKIEGYRSDVPSSPGSQQSAPMDESSDSDAPQSKPRGGDDEVNQYPVDGLFRDYEEKEQIMGMREIEREQILAERREENERIRQNRMLRQLKVNQDRIDKDTKKRKATAADLEDDRRKTARVRTKTGETSEKMDTLRRAREERSSRKEQRERENDRRKQQSPSFRRGSHDNGDSDVEWMSPNKNKPRSRTPETRESLPPDLRDFERIRLGRTRFAEVCFYPGFEEAITGCYVRVNIGPEPEKGQDVYRMAVIKGKLFGPRTIRTASMLIVI